MSSTRRLREAFVSCRCISRLLSIVPRFPWCSLLVEPCVRRLLHLKFGVADLVLCTEPCRILHARGEGPRPSVRLDAKDVGSFEPKDRVQSPWFCHQAFPVFPVHVRGVDPTLSRVPPA